MINLLTIPFFICLLFFQKPVLSNSKDEISIKMIVNNCASCHLENNHSDLIPSFFETERELFIKQMIDFQKINDDSIMHRITKVLNLDDIRALADYYYEKK